MPWRVPLCRSLFVLFSLFYGGACLQAADLPSTAVVPVKPGELFGASFSDLNNKPQTLAQWKGKVLVINFWATWCAPCRDEIPEFVELQRLYQAQGVQFVGIAVDNQQAVREFAKEYKINYPLLTGEQDVLDFMRKQGNRMGGLPFTIVVDRTGLVVAAAPGRLPKAKLEAALNALLQPKKS